MAVTIAVSSAINLSSVFCLVLILVLMIIVESSSASVIDCSVSYVGNKFSTTSGQWKISTDVSRAYPLAMARY